eukprot:1922048-Pyramimonas_sp.AAC.1
MATSPASTAAAAAALLVLRAHCRDEPDGSLPLIRSEVSATASPAPRGGDDVEEAEEKDKERHEELENGVGMSGRKRG